MTTGATRRVRRTANAPARPEDHGLIAHDLLSSAKDLCDRALMAFTEEDARAFYLNAGFSLEHALKAVLAAINPAMIAEPHDFESMLMLSRRSVSIQDVAPHLRTLQFDRCLANAGHVIPAIKKLTGRLKPLRSTATR